MAYTTEQIIEIAKISEFLCANELAKKGLYSGGIDGKLSRQIYETRKNVEWLYDLNSADTSLVQTGNYLFSLCGKYQLKALSIMNTNSGGIVVPSSPTGYIYTALSFVVTATPTDGQPTNGENTFQFNQFIGGLQFVYILAGGVTETVSEGQVTFDTGSGTMTRTNTFSTGETIIVPFLRLI